MTTAVIEYSVANNKECHLCTQITLFSHDLSQLQAILFLEVLQASSRY